MFYWLMKRIVAGPLLRGMFRPWVRGAENVPTTGGAILASNHLAVIDSFVLPGHREAKNFFKRFGLTARAIRVHKSLLPPA